MRDIAGCRIVLASDCTEELRRLSFLIEERWTDAKCIDYVTHPRSSGYRSIHLIVNESGYPVEIQLRTQKMHQWASDAEAFSDLFGENIKHDGDTMLHRFMWLRSEIESGDVPPTVKEEYQMLTTMVVKMLNEYDARRLGGQDE